MQYENDYCLRTQQQASPRRISLLCVAAILLGCHTGLCAPVATSISVDLTGETYAFRGWGTSLAWWANGLGDWPDKKLDDVIHLITSPTDGLGLTVFRYNIGGGEEAGHPPHMRLWADIPAYKSDSKKPYEWTADARQQRILRKLVKASAAPAIVELFSNSPPWWMTKSGCVAGSVDGGPNLKPEFEQAFVDYLADVCMHLRDVHHLNIATLEPMNEPDANWWKSTNRQEGCNVPVDQQARLIRLCRAALDARNMRETKVSATDANSIDQAAASLKSFDAHTLAALGQVNTHSYGGSSRIQLRDLAAKEHKPVWQSETGPLAVGGSNFEQILCIAQRIAIDLNHLRPEVWCTWQIFDGEPWGSLHADSSQVATPTQQFYMLATFTRAIRPGDRILPLERDDVLAAISDDKSATTLFLINREKQPSTIKLTLKNLPPDASREVQADRFSMSENLVRVEAPSLIDGVIEASLPPESILRLRLVTQPP